MYAYLKGNLTYKSPSLLWLEVAGVGYEINISLNTYAKIQHLEACKLYIHHRITDDAWALFGFADEEERETFRLLLGISGVGAMTARLILSALTSAELERTVSNEDAKSLERIKGIGAKGAQRIVLELKGKLQPGTDNSSITNNGTRPHNTLREDALVALVNLGINRLQADTAMKKLADTSEMTVEQLIKATLKAL